MSNNKQLHITATGALDPHALSRTEQFCLFRNLLKILKIAKYEDNVDCSSLEIIVKNVEESLYAGKRMLLTNKTLFTAILNKEVIWCKQEGYCYSDKDDYGVRNIDTGKRVSLNLEQQSWSSICSNWLPEDTNEAEGCEDYEFVDTYIKLD